MSEVFDYNNRGKMKHPIQKIKTDEQGVVRFERNDIVRFLLDAGPYDLNKLAMMPFSNGDRAQLAMLIGYSVSGFSELDYVSDEYWDSSPST